MPRGLCDLCADVRYPPCKYWKWDYSQSAAKWSNSLVCSGATGQTWSTLQLNMCISYRLQRTKICSKNRTTQYFTYRLNSVIRYLGAMLWQLKGFTLQFSAAAGERDIQISAASVRIDPVPRLSCVTAGKYWGNSCHHRQPSQPCHRRVLPQPGPAWCQNIPSRCSSAAAGGEVLAASAGC